MKTNIFLFFGILLLVIPLMNAIPSDKSSPINFNYPEKINYSDIVINETSNVTNTWSTDAGYLDTINETQMENSGGTLNILESWLTTFIESISKWNDYLLISDFSNAFDNNFSSKTTDDLTEGSTNKYDNSSWNESMAYDLFLNRSSESDYTTTYNATYDSKLEQSDLDSQVHNNVTIVKNNTSPTFQNLTFMGYNWIERTGDCESLPCMTMCSNSSGGMYGNFSGC